MQDGDFVVLRTGTTSVSGVGQVVGSYEWCDEFGDVDGWDLQHVRRVRWLWHSEHDPQVFDTYTMKQGDTTQKLGGGEVADWLANLDIPKDAWTRLLTSLPRAIGEAIVTVEHISEFLFDHGVVSASITTLLGEIGELTRIAKWYQRSEMPSEHETVAYLVVPLLRALGWTPQRMAVEWNHVDVALFERLPRVDESLRVLVEAKRMDNSCLSAASQAMSYAETRPQCRRLIVTDGLRYGVYVRTDTESPFKLHADLNLPRLRHDTQHTSVGALRMLFLRWLLSGSPMSESNKRTTQTPLRGTAGYPQCVGPECAGNRERTTTPNLFYSSAATRLDRYGPSARLYASDRETPFPERCGRRLRPGLRSVGWRHQSRRRRLHRLPAEPPSCFTT